MYHRGKLGAKVVSDLGAATVGELLRFPASELVARFGETPGAFLAALPGGGEAAPVRDRGPQKSLTCELSFPVVREWKGVAATLQPLAQTLWGRLLQVLFSCCF